MRKGILIAVLAVGSLLATAAIIQHDAEFDSDLVARAQITPEKARSTALATLSGRITEFEIEEENGRLIYSFDIENGDGKNEVEIDAMTGEVINAGPDDEDDDNDDDDDDKVSERGR